MTNNNLETAVLCSSNIGEKRTERTTNYGIKGIIFDLGNVVVPYSMYEYIRAVYKFLGIKNIKDDDIENAVSPKKMDLIRKYQKGMPRKEFFEEMGKQSNFPFAKNLGMLAEEATYVLFSDMDPEMERLIKGLKGNYPLAVLSNITEPHKEHVLKNYPLKELFDYLFFSCDVGMRKPEKEIFYFALDKMSLRPNEALFIDDYKGNVNAAKDIGINALLFNKTPELKSRLSEAGVYL